MSTIGFLPAHFPQDVSDGATQLTDRPPVTVEWTPSLRARASRVGPTPLSTITVPAWSVLRNRWDWDAPPVADWQVGIGHLTIGKGTPYGILNWEGFGLPDARINDLGYPSAHGVIALGDFHEGRPLIFEVCINERSSSREAWNRLKALTGAWQASVVDVALRIGIPDVGCFITPGRPRRAEADTTRLNKGQVVVALEFLCTDPRFYGVAVKEQVVAMNPEADPGGSCLSDPGWCLDPVANPCGLDLTHPQAEGLGIADNAGNTDTAPVFVFQGPATDPALINLTTGQVIDFEGTTLLVTDLLEVDTHNRRVVLDGTSRYDLLAPGSTFWRLAPGRNDLRYVAAAPEGSVTVRYRDAWL